MLNSDRANALYIRRQIILTMFKDEYQLDFFKEKNFIRKLCTECGDAFWTLDKDMETCQDSPCTEFAFIDNSPFDRPFTTAEMRRYFLDFFADRGHTALERYPVVARWRDDVFLVHASIYDFQPHATSGLVEPPGNPLVVSQPCIRMPDLEEVGRTGKHMTSFEMVGHHAFNSEDNYVYWKDETVRYCHEMLIELGLEEDEIAYKEHPWIGGGNAGPSLEVNVRGLEIATLVFMNLEKHPKGNVDLNGETYRPLSLNVVDTGYGLERYVWMSDGAPTIYDSIYPEIVGYICEVCGISHPLDDHEYRYMLGEYTKLAGRLKKDFTDDELMDDLLRIMEERGYFPVRSKLVKQLTDLRGVYTIADHSRTIAFMLTDGVVPSNVAEGYLARLMIRRTLRHIDRLNTNISLLKVVKKQMDKFADIIDTSRASVVFDMLENEIERYRETTEKGKRLVKRSLKRWEGETIPLESLIEFYDTHGIHPTIIKDMADELGVTVEIPDDFNVLLAQKHESPETDEKEDFEIDHNVPDTELLYYEDPNSCSSEAVVLYSRESDVILDRTCFYPEGGGQMCDIGELVTETDTYDVRHVRKEGGVVVHEIDGDIPVGETVRCIIDGERRKALTRHHTATHVIISSAREILGGHIWQRGAHKSPENARLDISHHRRVTRQQLKEIEHRANEIVLQDVPVEWETLSRDSAEKRFGFELYQGGLPASDTIRVVHISDVDDLDAQACGGTHVNSTGEIGLIKILSAQRIQDGVVRLMFSAGMAAVEHVQHMEELLVDTAETFDVDMDRIPETAERFFNEWKERGKELEKLKEYRSLALVDRLVPGEVERGVEFVISLLDDIDVKEMLGAAERITSEEDRVVLLASVTDTVQLVFSKSDNIEIDIGEVLREAAKEINGGGGGTAKTAQGGGNRVEGAGVALERAKKLILKELKE